MTSHTRLHQTLETLDRVRQAGTFVMPPASSEATIHTREEATGTTRPRALAPEGASGAFGRDDCGEAPLTTDNGTVLRKFGELRIGDAFFDPFCGEEFKKVSDTQGECLSGGDAFEGNLDDFEPDDGVQPAE